MIGQLPPRVASEIHDELLKLDPSLRLVSNLDEVPISGEDLFTLLSAAWLCGYSVALGDITPAVSDSALLPERVQMFADECGRR